MYHTTGISQVYTLTVHQDQIRLYQKDPVLPIKALLSGSMSIPPGAHVAVMMRSSMGYFDG